MAIDLERYISVNPTICHGKPCIRGTRIMVSTILELLEAGTPYKDIHKGYPALKPAHVKAALHFAHRRLEQGQFVPFHPSVHAVSR